MRNVVKEYIELNDVEKQELWDHAVFVFDTNVFLNLYRFSQKTRDMLIGAMTRLKDRIWMPNHVAHEFMEDRSEIVFATVDRYASLRKEVERLQKAFVESLRLKESDKGYQELQGNIENIQQWLCTHQKDNVIVTEISDDKILDTLLSLFDGKVGEPFSDEELDKIKTEGADRYKRKIPPGYKDAQKANSDNDNNAYGDLIVWKEIIRYAAEKKVDIVFVTHDRKEDWWNIIHGKTVGPRIELRKEFMQETHQRILVYNMDAFLRQSEDGQGREIDQSIVDEVQTMPQSFNGVQISKYPTSRVQSLTILQKKKFNLEKLRKKNMKRLRVVERLQSKYPHGDIPPEIIDQINNTYANYQKTEERIRKLEEQIISVKLEG